MGCICMHPLQKTDGQQAGSMHLTGMHTCIVILLPANEVAERYFFHRCVGPQGGVYHNCMYFSALVGIFHQAVGKGVCIPAYNWVGRSV